jgi:ribosome recycling factor
MDENQVRSKMQQVLELINTDIASIRTGRATPSLVEDIVVPAYGGTQRLKIVELASISAPDTQTLVIDPWDKSIIGDIRKGIMEANVGLNPAIDNQIVRISLPPLTTEDRQKYVKMLGVKLENGKVMIRQIRGDVMKDIKDAFEKKELTEDEKFQEEKKLQELTDKFVGHIEEMGEKKEKELLQI